MPSAPAGTDPPNGRLPAPQARSPARQQLTCANDFAGHPGVNRRLSSPGALWRDIESYLAANPGLFCFVRLAYPRGTSTDIPAEVEYGIMAEEQLRTAIFPNS